MPLSLWLSMSAICILGAISPGPSLAVVIRNTVTGGRSHGIITALAHGTGIAIWALLTATGIGLLISRNPALFEVIRWTGAVALVYLAIRYLRTRSDGAVPSDSKQTPIKQVGSPFRDGFLISVTNPKIALFFLALFSQFVRPDADWSEKVVMVGTASTIDTAWYIFVVVTLSHSAILAHLQQRAVLLDRIFGLVLIALALAVAI